MVVMPKKKKQNNKERGNKFEREVAKQLSLWLFDDPNLLRRHPDSGASKMNYTGDICPAAQLPQSWKGQFPFQVETKYGYTQIASPSPWNTKWLTEWYLKSLEESKLHNQKIIFVINNFVNRKFNTLTTDRYLNDRFILHKMSFPIIKNGLVTHLFVYKFKDVINLNFTDLIPNFFKEFIRNDN